MKILRPPHPGEILKEKYMDTSNFNVTTLAKTLGVRRATVSDIVNIKSGISFNMAEKLGKTFHTKPAFWLSIDAKYKLNFNSK